MKRLLIAPLLTVALLVPALALAATHNLAGTVDPGGTVSMTVKKRNGHTKVVKFAFQHVPISCDSGDDTTSGNTSGYTFKVDDQNRFSGKLTNGAQPPSILTVNGKVLRHGKAAKGTIRVKGATQLDSGPTGSNCDTGKDDWSASEV